MRSVTRYFFWPFIMTVVGLSLSFWLGWGSTGRLSGALSFLLIGVVLAILEISLSFDNAIVNANKLKDMRPEWQRRFLTWGILIAVFGMRIIFPLAVVAVAAWIGPVDAIRLAAREPQEYARIMDEAHVSIAAFGGTFLMMVALSFFIDGEKEVHWIHGVERRFRAWSAFSGLSVGLVLAIALCFTAILDGHHSQEFLFASICGLVTFLAVDLLGQILDTSEASHAVAATGGLGAFLYLEVLDASFSFDGVIGAFALTQNLFLIAIGLGIGAFYVRTMTIMLVEKQTLTQFRYLEHGAFYSILALSVIMFGQSVIHIPEVITGLVGAGLIGMSLVASIRHNRTHPEG